MSTDKDMNLSGVKLPSTPQQPQQPFTPPRPTISSPSRLPALQMPGGRSSPTAAPDPALGYAAVRRPRLDFARACTSLHHSTLAEKSSPDSSPQSGGCGAAGNNSGTNHQQQTNHPSNFSSYNAAFPSSSTAPSVDGSNHEDDSSTDDDDDDLDLDLMAGSTTQTPISNPFRNSFSMDSSPTLMNSHQAIQAAVLMRNPKSRLRLKPSRGSSTSSGSAGGNSSLASPSPTTPPPMGGGNGYFGRGAQLGKRRDSLSQVIRDSFTLQGDPILGAAEEEANEIGPETSEAIRRVVTRRGNLLPKTKNFQRIKAALQEESSPLDIEVKREAEVTRQLREDDDAQTIKHSILPSPQLLPTAQTLDPEEIDDFGGIEDESMGGGSEFGLSRKNSTGSRNGSIGSGDTMAFNKRAQMFGTFNFDSEMSLSGNGYASPPRFPPRDPQRTNSDGDVVMDNGSSTVSSPVVPVTMKRRRTQEERFEELSNFKRRAVSPGLCGSPILTGSPASGGSGNGGGGGKRLNFGQGISDTHDGLMKMSLQ